MTHAFHKTDFRESWQCREVMHSGDGPARPPQTIRSLGQCDPQEAAENFASILDDREETTTGADVLDFMDSRRVIEVLTDSGWKRFDVRRQVVRQYHAQEIK